MKNQNFHYVIEFDNGGYLKELGGLTDQLRLAKMYNSIKYAHEGAQSAIPKINKYTPKDNPYYIKGYRIIEVKIEVLSDHNTPWTEVE